MASIEMHFLYSMYDYTLCTCNAEEKIECTVSVFVFRKIDLTLYCPWFNNLRMNNITVLPLLRKGKQCKSLRSLLWFK